MAKRSNIKQSSPAEDDDEEMEEDEEEVDRRRSRGGSKSGGKRGVSRSFKAWWRDARRWVLPILFVAALFLFILGVAAIWFPTAFGPDVAGMYSQMGAFSSYFFLLGLLVFAGVGYLEANYMMKLREFSRLVGTKSKSDFIRTQDKIERLAFELGSAQQDQVTARKREFRIRH